MRDFNTSGPVRPEEHYCVPVLDRIDLAEVLALIGRRRYFILHAPRQTGKTSTLLALRDLLNGGSAGHYRCVYVNVEPGQSAREDVGQAMGAILDGLAKQLRRTLGDSETAALAESMDTSVRSHSVLGRVLTSWAENGARAGGPAHRRDRLARRGHADLGTATAPRGLQRPSGRVPAERDPKRCPRCEGLSYPGKLREGPRCRRQRLQHQAKSLRLGDFDRDEVTILLGQHTAATGQKFAPEAVAAVWEQTRGQPWLVNALAQEMCFEYVGNPRRIGRKVNEGDVFQAREALIRRRETHIDQLADKPPGAPRAPRDRTVAERRERKPRRSGPRVRSRPSGWSRSTRRCGSPTPFTPRSCRANSPRSCRTTSGNRPRGTSIATAAST